MNITFKSIHDIAAMREGGKILGKILVELAKSVVPGITTKWLDEKTRVLLKQYNAEPSFLGYRGFPGVICTPVNNEVVHTIPNNRPLKDGDILTIDFGVLYKGFHTDSAISIGVGAINEEKKRLIQIGEKALLTAIKKVKHGTPIRIISETIQKIIEGNGCRPIRELIGHGIGKNLHENPQIPNFGPDAPDFILKTGMTIAIEPIFCAGKAGVKTLEDGWNIVTKDGSLAMQVEHTLAITEAGCEILTKREELDPVYPILI